MVLVFFNLIPLIGDVDTLFRFNDRRTHGEQLSSPSGLDLQWISLPSDTPVCISWQGEAGGSRQWWPASLWTNQKKKANDIRCAHQYQKEKKMTDQSDSINVCWMQHRDLAFHVWDVVRSIENGGWVDGTQLYWVTLGHFEWSMARLNSLGIRRSDNSWKQTSKHQSTQNGAYMHVQEMK